MHVMIPVARKDVHKLAACIQRLKRFSVNPLAQIHIVGSSHARESAPRLITNDPKVHWIDEEGLSPSLDEVRRFMTANGYQHDNWSWYFQQVLKLRSPDILQTSQVLVVDADFAPVRPITFVDEQNRMLMDTGYPLMWDLSDAPYRIPHEHVEVRHAGRLIPGWRPVDPYSGMHHHMVFDGEILQDMERNATGRGPLWQQFLRTVHPGDRAGASEFMINRHYAETRHPDRVRRRTLDGFEVIQSPARPRYTLEDVARAASHAGIFDVAGAHEFADWTDRIKSMGYLPPDLRTQLIENMDPIALQLSGGRLSLHVVRDGMDLGDAVELPSTNGSATRELSGRTLQATW